MMRAKGEGRYRSNKVVYDGITFDSELEGKYYIDILKPEKELGNIRDLKFQVPYQLIPSFFKGNKKVLGINYVADFTYVDNKGTQHVIDVKGMETEGFLLKEKLFNYFSKNSVFLEPVAFARYCGWVSVDRIKELRRVRKKYKLYGKKIAAKTMTKADDRMMEKIKMQYGKYLGDCQ